MKLLASVRTPQEAAAAAAAGADIVDLKEPRAGALGALPLPVVVRCVAVLRACFGGPISATIGDLPPAALPAIVARAREVAATGVDYVKVGVVAGPYARATLQSLAALPVPIVPLFIADHGLDEALFADALALRFPILMVDTADKRAGSLFERVPLALLDRLCRRVQQAGARIGLAGALRAEHVPLLRELAPDIAGFRGALCVGDRAGRLDAERVRALGAALRAPLTPASAAPATAAAGAAGPYG
ncbi:MAG: (5-formylfuran-3-yl)methyl phosphate synthase [Burkholderiaceae bacterium]|nr:(5-formylfuran-3-yl)methyl phosphate synthase [Burkholderiaceae bacterium]